MRMSHLEAWRQAKAALEALHEAEIRYGEACVAAFPVGSNVEFRYGRHVRSGRVVMHGNLGDRLKIVGATGKEYWIDSSMVLQWD